MIISMVDLWSNWVSWSWNFKFISRYRCFGVHGSIGLWVVGVLQCFPFRLNPRIQNLIFKKGEEVPQEQKKNNRSYVGTTLMYERWMPGRVWRARMAKEAPKEAPGDLTLLSLVASPAYPTARPMSRHFRTPRQSLMKDRPTWNEHDNI